MESFLTREAWPDMCTVACMYLHVYMFVCVCRSHLSVYLTFVWSSKRVCLCWHYPNIGIRAQNIFAIYISCTNEGWCGVTRLRVVKRTRILGIFAECLSLGCLLNCWQTTKAYWHCDVKFWKELSIHAIIKHASPDPCDTPHCLYSTLFVSVLSLKCFSLSIYCHPVFFCMFTVYWLSSWSSGTLSKYWVTELYSR